MEQSFGATQGGEVFLVDASWGAAEMRPAAQSPSAWQLGGRKGKESLQEEG